MGTLLLEQIKKQTANYIQEKYNIARMKFSDVTEMELLTERATNKDPCSPDAKTMTKIAEASFELDDYWRIVDILHQRLYSFKCEEWRQSYKALVLLEFLLTHGPEDFAVEFQCDSEVIEELGSFNHVDERGFNWGARMRIKSDQILKLLQGGVILREARLKALKITNEIQGFGSLDSPSSASSCSSSSEAHSGSSFCSFSSSSSTPAYIDSLSEFRKNPFSPTKETNINYSLAGTRDEKTLVFRRKHINNYNEEDNHLWDGPIGEEKDYMVGFDDQDGGNDEKPKDKPKGFVNGICSKLIHSGGSLKGNGEKADFQSISDVENKDKKKLQCQHSLWY